MVLLPLIYSFFTGASLAFFVTSATSLFLSSFDRQMLPPAFIAAGILVWLSGQLYARFQEHVIYGKVLTGGILILLFSVIAFLVFYIETSSVVAVFLLYAWIRVFAYMHAVTFWGMAGKLFTLRQGKRVFGLITGGEVFASIISFLSIPFLLKLIETEDLLLISGTSLIIGFLILIYIVKKFKHKLLVKTETQRTEIKATEKNSKKFSYFKNNYYKLFFIVAFLPIFSQFFVDFIFQSQAKAEFPQRESLTAFVGIFFGVSAMVEFILKTLVSGKLMSKYGMKFGLTAFPVMLFISFFMASFFGLLYGTATLFFSFVSLGRLFTRAVRTSFNDPAAQILFQPLPPEERTFFQNKIESGPKAFASIAAGIVLFIFTGFYDLSLVWFSVFLLAVIIFWYKSAEKMFLEYKKIVQDILKKRKKEEKLSENEKIFNFVLKIKDSLSDTNKQILFNFCKIVFPYKKNIIFPDKKEKLPDLKLKEIIELAHSPDALERKIAAELFAEQNFYKIEIFLNKLLNDNDFKVRTAAILTAGKIKEPELFKFLLANLRIKEYHDIAFSAIINTGKKILPDLERFFYKTEFFPEIQISVIKLIENIGTAKAVKILHEKINYTDKRVANAIISALSRLRYSAKRSDITALEQKMEEETSAFVYICACLYDLRKLKPEEDIIRALRHEKRNKKNNIFTTLSLIYDAQAIELIKTNLDSDNPDDVGFALEIADTVLSDLHKEVIFGVFENVSEFEILNKYKYEFPQEHLDKEQRLTDIINSEIIITGNYTKTIALSMLSEFNSKEVIRILKANMIHPDYLIEETAAIGLYFKDKELFLKQSELLKNTVKDFEKLSKKIILQKKNSSLLVLEKLRLLKSLEVFTDISFEKLTKFAVNSEDFSLKAGEVYTVNLNKNSSSLFLCVLGTFVNENTGDTVNTGEFVSCFEDTDIREMKFRARDPVLIFKGQSYLLYNLFAENLNFAKRITRNIIHSV